MVVEEVTPPGEPNKLREKRRGLLERYQRQFSEGLKRLASCVAAVDAAETRGANLTEGRRAHLVYAVNRQMGRIDTLDLELSLQELESGIPATDTSPASTFDEEALTEALARQAEQVREQTRVLILGWVELTRSRRELLRQRARLGSELKPAQAQYRIEHEDAIASHESAVAAKLRELQALRERHQQELQALLEQMAQQIPILGARLLALYRLQQVVDLSRLDVLESDLQHVRRIQGELFNLLQTQRDEASRQDREMQALRSELLNNQLDQDDLEARIEAVRALF